jgi:hypothetical protein
MTNENTPNNADLMKQADELLKSSGCGIWGEQRNRDSYVQSKFEDSMTTGAYSANCSKRQ